MTLESINPATGERIERFEPHDAQEIDGRLAAAAAAQPVWAAAGFAHRGRMLSQAAQLLREKRDEFAGQITREMGKLAKEARGEIEKCAWVCDYYAEHGTGFMADEVVETDAGKSYVAYQPLGTVLAIMPWNFPFWQVFRFAAPALMAGNAGVLKHASNVTGCARTIERIFRDAGADEGVFQTLVIGSDQVAPVIHDDRIHAVTLTGSEGAGRQVASEAGKALKKSVLELGGSDPFIVLEDADLELAASQAAASRYMNSGQSCIAAKRFIVVESVADDFVDAFRTQAEALEPGDPADEATGLAPLARADLRDALDEQIQASIGEGARVVTGGAPVPGTGNYYPASVLDRVTPDMRVAREETFGPAAAVLRVPDEAAAVRAANASRYGLGGSVWTSDLARGEAVALQLECGSAFVNGLVKSDPRLPFGGVKASGYGRELAWHGMREFVNAKTVWIR